jgi:hypothetical protein
MSPQSYLSQSATWPSSGRHILASFNDDSIVVYQAYRPAIAAYAVQHQKFGGEFSYGRMSWIKPNFLWMMYRSGWGTKEGQEHILAIRIEREFFDDLLLHAVASSYDPERHASRQAWQEAVESSDVRLQWDPDHDPSGKAIERRAVQLGLRGAALRRFGEQPISIEDITPFVTEQRAHVESLASLLVPSESVYRPPDQSAKAIGIDVHAP